jgi:aryl-alcohol dehydrogenase-like predicted oxidoreductase
MMVTLGSSDLRVVRVGLGCMGMSDFYGPDRDEAAAVKTLRGAIDLGVNFFDTADIYGVGHNEQLVGKAFAGRWNDIVLATKYGIRRTPEGEFLGPCGWPEFVMDACDKSLKRLGVEVIDLYYQHRPDPAVPVEESVGAM